MNGESVCAKHHHPVHHADAKLLYDEVSHKIDNNILSVKLIKDRHRIQTADGHAADATPIDVDCFDSYGKKCKESCPKVNVVHNQVPPPKKPEEEMLLLRAIRQITPNDDMKHSLQVEFKSPRNYTPLPEPGPLLPIIVPKEPITVKTNKIEGKKENKLARRRKKVKRSR